MGLGQGINRVTLGDGHDVVFAKTGSTGMSTITAGQGSADIGLGGKSVDLVLPIALEAQTLTLFGFRVGVDSLQILETIGTGSGDVAAALAGQSNPNGSTVRTIGSKTTVFPVGLAHADQSVFGPSI